ncbi:MAG: hypothetical protein F8N37_00125 [Telmatospirillum sp.]|nr:hypothetical protein [Telmatospirillum sp.]
MAPESRNRRRNGQDRVLSILAAFAFLIMAMAAFANDEPAAAGVAMLAALFAVILWHRASQTPEMPEEVQELLCFVADELAQYRAFTRLLRDQGGRINDASGEAALVIVEGLREIDRAVETLRIELRKTSEELPLDAIHRAELAQRVEAIGRPILRMLGCLQFQDVTQQQIAFLSRLSLMVDDHMVRLARKCGDRRAVERLDKFKEMFAAALDDTVMTNQRDDFYAATGLALQEEGGPRIEMF